MNPFLAKILQQIQDLQLNEEERQGLLKSITDADKQWTITDFKLDRTEKIKKTTSILLEETIEELEQKRIAVEAQNKELEIEKSLEKVRAVAMGMNKQEDLLDICESLFVELGDLGYGALRNTMINVHNNENSSFVNYDYSDLLGRSCKTVPYDSNPMLKKQVLEINKADDAFSEATIEGQDLREWINFRKRQGEKDDPRIKEDSSLHYYIYSIGKSSIGISTLAPLPIEKLELLKRFRNVFKMAYQRYADIMQAEAQAGEARIEAALERVRSRTMAMHKTDELLVAAELVAKELFALGINSMNVSYAFVDKEENSASYYSVNPVDGKVLPFPFVFPHTETEVMRSILASWKKQEAFNLISLDAEGTTTHQRWIGEHILQLMVKNGIPFSVEEFLNVSPKTAVIYTFNFAQGYLFVIGEDKLTASQEELVLRFTKVFEMTYRRFLDLQKAEAQAREGQIELAIERVRARTMAMHKSEELADISFELVKQVQSLGVATWHCAFNIYDEGRESSTEWGSNEWGTYPKYKTPREGIFLRYYEIGQTGEKLHIEVIGEDICAAHYAYLCTLPGVGEQLIKVRDSGIPFPTSQIDHVAYFKYGYLLFITYDPVPEAHEVFKRFAKVFEQAYTRFLDLQKAEAQAKEAKVEAALERVRSRSMSMQESKELQEVIQVVFDQFVYLDIHIGHAGFVIDYKNRDDYYLWIADPLGVPAQVTVPYFDSLYYNSFNLAKEQGLDFFATNLSFDEKNTFYGKLFEYIPGLPDHVKEFYFNCAGLAISTVLLDNVSLYIENFEGRSYTDEENATLMRFGKVFQQTYTRFLDLQKAESSANEALKQASLDRIRGQVASMRTTSDLETIIPLLWRELCTLNIPFIRCGVFIMDEVESIVNVYLSTPDGHSLGLLHLPFATGGVTEKAVEYWRMKKVFKAHWNKQEFIEWMKTLVSMGELKETKTYQGAEEPPDSLHLNFVPFQQGMLYVGDAEALNEDVIELIQRLAETFSIAYSRYEDFRLLENAKNKVETTLVELKSAQSQLIQAEKMASLGELTAGIAHEIQNPLNFVNNFSELNAELFAELKDALGNKALEEADEIISALTENEQKINHHGKRADAIVKGMLQHSRTSTGEKELADINMLADEYLRLAYHGFRAKEKNFNTTLETDLDGTIGKVRIIPQEMGRVLLNLYNNAFYAVKEKSGLPNYDPKVKISTLKNGNQIVIEVQDNGNGIPEKVKEKIFQPFFTTKPTGQGTGLGLSLSYDIVRAHGGEFIVESKEGEGSCFKINLPVS